jgi:hypothetical protein
MIDAELFKKAKTRTARIEIDWADGTHAFRLAFRELIELDEKRQCGPFELLNRIQSGTWRAEDVREVIRIGLIGGGMEPGKALAMVRRYVEEVPDWHSNSIIASAILMAALAGNEVEDPGKSEAVDGTAQAPEKTDASPSPPFSEVQPSSEYSVVN